MATERTEKARNAARIARLIWEAPLISRAEIAERLGLERSTITHQVADLIAGGLVSEISEGSAGPSGGRRPIHLSIAKDYGYVIGIEMQVEAYSVIAVNLAGDVLAFRKEARTVTAASFVDDVLSIARDFAAEVGAGRRLIGVGVGLGGIVDSERGVIRYSIPLDLTEPLDFAAAAAGRTDVPVLIGNDANCCAQGELAFHKAEGSSDFLFALVQFRTGDRAVRDYGGVGVGLGIVTDGKVRSGPNFTAGEFRSAFWTEGNRAQFSIPYEEIRSVTTDGALMERFVGELSRNLAVLVNTFDLERVFIGGDVEGFDVDFPGILDRELRRNWMYPLPVRCRASYSTLGERAVAYGAAGMFLSRIFTSTHLSLGGPEDGGPLARVLES